MVSRILEPGDLVQMDPYLARGLPSAPLGVYIGLALGDVKYSIMYHTIFWFHLGQVCWYSDMSAFLRVS